MFQGNVHLVFEITENNVINELWCGNIIAVYGLSRRVLHKSMFAASSMLSFMDFAFAECNVNIATRKANNPHLEEPENHI